MVAVLNHSADFVEVCQPYQFLSTHLLVGFGIHIYDCDLPTISLGTVLLTQLQMKLPAATVSSFIRKRMVEELDINRSSVSVFDIE